MSDVKRYDPYFTASMGGRCTAFMEEDKDGDYVLHSDYAALQAKLEIARSALTDIALSNDMTLKLAQNKALRIYGETATEPTKEPT